MEDWDPINVAIHPSCLQEPPLAIDVIKREWPTGFLSLIKDRPAITARLTQTGSELLFMILYQRPQTKDATQQHQKKSTF